MANVRFNFRPEGLIKINSPGGIVNQGVAKAAGRLRDQAKLEINSAGRVNNGTLQGSIISRHVSTSTRGVTYEVGSSLPYARYQHDGVKGPIYPRRAKVLRFESRGKVVFARFVSGFKGIFFLTKPLAKLKPRDFL